MTHTVKDDIEIPPASGVRVKRKSLKYSVCPRCHRTSGVDIVEASEEAMVLKLHQDIWECLLQLSLYPNYKDTVPLDLRIQKLPGFWSYGSNLFLNMFRKQYLTFLLWLETKK